MPRTITLQDLDGILAIASKDIADESWTRVYPDGVVIVYRYPQGDCDTVSWPSPNVDQLIEVLDDHRETGVLLTDDIVLLPDGKPIKHHMAIDTIAKHIVPRCSARTQSLADTDSYPIATEKNYAKQFADSSPRLSKLSNSIITITAPAHPPEPYPTRSTSCPRQHARP